MGELGVGDVQRSEGRAADYGAAIDEMLIKFGIDRSQIDEPALMSAHEEISEWTNPGRELLMFVRSRRSTPSNIVRDFESYLLAMSYAQIARGLQEEANGAADPAEASRLENAARRARTVSIILADGQLDRTTVDIIIGIRNNLRNPETRNAGIHLLNLAVEHGPDDTASAKTLENFISILWEGFHAADWQGIVQRALEKMAGKYEFVPNTDLTFTTDVPWDADMPITSPRQWSPSIWHELHSSTRLEKGFSTRSLLTLLLSGETYLFESFRNLSSLYKEQGDEGQMQRRALNHLLLVAASQKLSDARRYIVQMAIKIIASDEFRYEISYRQSLREIVDDLIYILSRPEVNPKIEQEVTVLTGFVYGTRGENSRYSDFGNALFLLRPLIDQSYRQNVGAAASLEELAANYAREKSGNGPAGGAAPADSGPSAPPAPAAPAASGGPRASASEYEIADADYEITAADGDYSYEYPDDVAFDEGYDIDTVIGDEEIFVDADESWTWSTVFYTEGFAAVAAL